MAECKCKDEPQPIYQLKYIGVGGGVWTDVTPYQFKMLRKDEHYESRILYTQPDNKTVAELREKLELAEACLSEWRNSVRPFSC